MTESKGPKMNKKSSPTKWIVGGITAAIVVIIAIVLAVGGGSDTANNTSDTNGTAVSGEFMPVTILEGEALPPLGDPENDPAQGTKAPVVQGSGFSGMEMTIRPAGKPVLLVFLAHWCPHCNAEIPRLIEWQESGQMPEDLVVVGVTTGSRSDQPNWPPSQWVQDMEWPWAVLADSEAQDAAIAYGVNGYPGLVLLDGEGTVLARRSGEASVSELDVWADTYLGI
jgi:thiol-disulfide isomerase/thioredoxin